MAIEVRIPTILRTYTDGNVRLYVTTANRQLRAPTP